MQRQGGTSSSLRAYSFIRLLVGAHVSVWILAGWLPSPFPLQRRIEEKQVQLRLLQKQLDAAAAGTPSPTAGSPLSSSVRAGGRLGGGGEAEGEQEDVRKLRLDLCEKELELEELRTEMNLKRKEKAQQDVDDILKAGKK